MIVPDTVALPDGTIVRLLIEVVNALPEPPNSASEFDFASEPSFCMWVDREDMADSVAWVNWQRDAWQERLTRTD